MVFLANVLLPNTTQIFLNISVILIQKSSLFYRNDLADLYSSASNRIDEFWKTRACINRHIE